MNKNEFLFAWNLKNEATLLVVEEHGDNAYWFYWKKILDELIITRRVSVAVIDLTEVTRVRGYRSLLNPENLQFVSSGLSMRKKFLEYANKRGAEIVSVDEKYLKACCAPNYTLQQLTARKDSVQSALITEIMREVDSGGRRYSRNLRIQERIFDDVSTVISRFLSNNSEINQVLVCNGRLPSQAAAGSMGAAWGRRVMYVEHGGSRLSRVHLELWQANSRVKFQESFRERFLNSTIDIRSQLLSQVRNINTSIPNPPTKFFNSGKLSKQIQHLLLNSRVACIALSSPDEFIGMGKEWDEGRWLNQEDALIEVIPFLRKAGFEVLVRVHPNAMQKSWREYRRLHKSFDELDCYVVAAHSVDSTNEIMGQSNLVLTWGSTAGVEAVILGKPTWLLGRSQYDNLVDIRKWPETGEPDKSELQYDPDVHSGEKYLEGFSNRGYALDFANDSFERAVLNREAHRRLLTNVIRRILTPIEIFRRPYVFFNLFGKIFGRRYVAITCDYVLRLNVKSRI